MNQDFAIIDGKTIPFKNLSEAVGFKKQPRSVETQLMKITNKQNLQTTSKNYNYVLVVNDDGGYYTKYFKSLNVNNANLKKEDDQAWYYEMSEDNNLLYTWNLVGGDKNQAQSELQNITNEKLKI